jgi:hypothetical protein
MKDLVLENWKYALWILFGSGLIFEISPLKFSPISSFLNWIGKKLNKDVEDKISKIDIKVDKVQSDLQSHKVESQRRDILNFADKVMRGEQKTKEDYQSIIKSHDRYVKYISENNLENGEIDLAFEYISQQYKECLKNNGFYTGK